MKRVLAFGCHPDDVEFMCAGTLALLAERGWEVHIATMTGGEVGSATLRGQDIRAKRLAEAAAAAGVIDATYHFAGGHDLQVRYEDAYQRLVVAVIRSVDPTMVLTHMPSDYLIDHEETSRLVRNGAFIASVPLYDCGRPVAPTQAIPHLYYWNAFGGRDIFGRPIPVTFGIDVSKVMEVKKRMLACHASQRDWLAYINGFDAYLDEMDKTTAEQGRQIRRGYGECYIQHVGNGHPTDNLLAKELGDLSAEIPQ